jgi:hypothetical protein
MTYSPLTFPEDWNDASIYDNGETSRWRWPVINAEVRIDAATLFALQEDNWFPR